MTSVSPTAGVAPLPVGAAPAQPTSLHAVLAGGANLGGDTVTSDDYGLPAIPGVGSAVAGASGVAPGTTTPTTTGGGGVVAAAQGAAPIQPEQLIPVLQQLVSTIEQLIAALQSQQAAGVSGGGGIATAGCGCGMPGCTMGQPMQQAGAGADGGVEAAPARDARRGAHEGHDHGSPGGAGTVDPSSVKDKTSTNGLSAASKRGLEEAHRYGLPLVSGKRGGSTKSDHFHGNAIDVGTLPIGVPGSDGGTPQMKAFAERMRQAGKAGQLDVKYVIADGRIASATNNWEWRPYTYPGKSASELEALKQSNRGEYNRLQHYDHVHVSFR